jgi:ferredoxin, 2Fe-2S
VTDRQPVVTVRVEPSNVQITVRSGEPLMRAAERLGYHWPTICHGQAECTVCWIEVDDTDAFEPPQPLELKGLRLFEGRSFYAGRNIRLACQARPVDDTVVTKRGVRPAS